MVTRESRSTRSGTIFRVSPRNLPECAKFALSEPGTRLPTPHPEEAALITPFMVSERQNSFRRGRAAAHAALAAINMDDGPVLIGADREPLWPNGVVGSISHAAGFGVALVARAADTDGVGIDIEQMRHAPELNDQVLGDEERSWIGQLPKDKRDKAVFEVFSAKESVFKAFFRRRGSFFDFDVASLSPVQSGFGVRLVGGFDDEYPPTRMFFVGCHWFKDIVLTTLVLPKSHRDSDDQAT